MFPVSTAIVLSDLDIIVIAYVFEVGGRHLGLFTTGFFPSGRATLLATMLIG